MQDDDRALSDLVENLFDDVNHWWAEVVRGRNIELHKSSLCLCQNPWQDDPLATEGCSKRNFGCIAGSSNDFINAVNARWVIFSAGHAHEHPLEVTATRYINIGYAPECMLRTDLGDDHGNEEWDFGRINNHTDQAFDDPIEITLPGTGGDPTVGYIGETPVACPDLGLTHDGGPPAPVEVRMSRNQICHTPDSPWYDRMSFFTEFDSVQACINAGGRLPR